MKYKNGDIVIALLTFENGKRMERLCLVIDDSLVEVIAVHNITKQEKKHIKTNKFIKKSRINGLHEDSYVKTNVIYKIRRSKVIKYVGHESNYKDIVG